jgi:hypothetical protein
MKTQKWLIALLVIITLTSIAFAQEDFENLTVLYRDTADMVDAGGLFIPDSLVGPTKFVVIEIRNNGDGEQYINPNFYVSTIGYYRQGTSRYFGDYLNAPGVSAFQMRLNDRERFLVHTYKNYFPVDMGNNPDVWYVALGGHIKKLEME